MAFERNAIEQFQSNCPRCAHAAWLFSFTNVVRGVPKSDLGLITAQFFLIHFEFISHANQTEA